MNHHTIRLRGPWSYSLLDSDNRPTPGGILKLPANWAEALAVHSQVATSEVPNPCVEFHRKFNQPTGLTEASQIVLSIRGLPADIVVGLNDHPLANHLGSPEEWQTPITPWLQPHNRLVLRVTFQPEREYHGEVDLRIFEGR